MNRTFGRACAADVAAPAASAVVAMADSRNSRRVSVCRSGACYNRRARRTDPRSALTQVATGSYFSKMRAVGLKVLKNKLSEYIRLAASGETVLVTDRDTVVAEISPPTSGRAEHLGDALLAEAVRKGWLRPPTLASTEPPLRKPVMRWSVLAKELDEDRENR